MHLDFRAPPRAWAWRTRFLPVMLLLFDMDRNVVVHASNPLPPPPSIRIQAQDPVNHPRHQRFDLYIQVDNLLPDAESLEAAQMDIFITLPSGATRHLPAFAHQPHHLASRPRGGRLLDWLYPVGETRWEARFTPTEAGRHTARARLQLASGSRNSESIVFEAAAPSDPPFVGVHPADPRFFGTPDGKPYIPVGLNLAFIGPNQYLTLDRFDAVLGKMAAAGGNFARIWTGCEDWALGLEARKSAWGRSWDWRPPFVPQTGNIGYHDPDLVIQLEGTPAAPRTFTPTTPTALLASTAYRLSGYAKSGPGTPASGPVSLEVLLDGHGPLVTLQRQPGEDWQSFEVVFETTEDEWWLPELRFRLPEPGKILLKALSLREAGGGPELLGEADPNRPLRGRVNPLDCSMLDYVVESAERHGILLQLCLFTRDHYRSDLTNPLSPAYTRAIRDAQRLLRYAVARWGYSPNVFAWEYFNEMDPNAPTADFHDALGRYLRQTDPYQHLRTTSGWAPAPAHWTHPELDVADLHWYLRPSWGELSRDVVGAVIDRTALIRSHAANRPAVLGEFGLADDRWGLSPWMRRDPEGIHFHNALWASAFSGLSGVASFWWWETVDQLDYYHHFRPLSKFLAGLPWASPGWGQSQLTTRRGSRALLWRNFTGVYGWIANPEATWWKRLEEGVALNFIDSDQLDLAGVAPGNFDLLWFDTWRGTEIATTPLRVEPHTPCSLPIPSYTADLAFRLVPKAGEASSTAP